MMNGEEAADRKVLRVAGSDRIKFLQGLVTNDVNRVNAGLVYAALLTPQGKYLADFFLAPNGETILLDCKASQSEALMQRLSLHKLRADLSITETDLHVWRGTGAAPAGAFPDPRHPALGWRYYSETPGREPSIDWDRLRVSHTIPETGIELVANETFILEVGFEKLNGVDFRKGCYVGQEVTARMKHKTELRKGLVNVAVKGSAPVGTEINVDGKNVGTLYTQSAGEGLAYLRFDRSADEMTAGAAKVSLNPVGTANG